uniref:HAT C-terminal dimerisation domain-containing protein n=1 Tax=Latimeria chalumnae TaxID=7897 RepID=H2ZRS2_LATCH
DIWNQKQWEQFKETYPWLDCKDRKLGCLDCSAAKTIGVFKEQGISLANEWCSYSVEASGNESRNIKLASLRIKIKKHVDSKAHGIAHKIQDQRKANVLGKTIEAISGVVDQASEAVFRTAYYLAKNNCPFSNHENLIELQNSRYSTTGIVNHIAKEMWKNLVKSLVSSSSKLAVLIDESTTLSRKATLIVYLKAPVEGESPIFMFLDLVELEYQRAEGVVSALIECLQNAGFTDCYLQENWVSFVSDGASVMLGRNSGVATRLCLKYPQLFTWHCTNHRLELAVADAIDEVTTVNHFKAFMEKLHNTYSQSNKNEWELHEALAEVGSQILCIGRILDVRWVASSFRTVQTVWMSFGALYKHFENASSDALRNGKERQTYMGLAARLASLEFLCDLVLMYDVLYEVANLSRLQARSMTIPRAEHLDSPVDKCKEAIKAKDLEEFKSITLKPNPKLNCINIGQLLQSLVNNMEECLSNGDDILADFSILDSSRWPSNPSIHYGEGQVKRLCRRFSLNTKQKNPNSEPEDLKPLMVCMQTFPCSTAECERGFSLMNNIATDKRAVLSVSNIANLMLINMNG